jgi:hypothetical protein
MQEIDQTGVSPNHSARYGAKVRLFVLHTQEGPGSAQSLAGYLQNAASEVSYHYSVDNSTCIDVVDTDRASWSVLDANGYCINLCFAGSRASQSRQVWLDQYGAAIDYAAKLFVQDAKKYDPLAPIVIDHQALRAGKAGGTDHAGITAMGIGTHTDCGPNFPWDVYSAAVAKYATDYVSPAPVPVPNAIDAEATRAGAWIGNRHTAGELSSPDGRGKFAEFDNGHIYWTPTTGAHAIPSSIFDTFHDFGFETGPLGYPVGDHTVLADGDVQGFEGGAIYRRTGQPGFAVWGQIRERWNRTGFEGGEFGWPTSNEVKQPDGSAAQDFERGRIVWSPDGTTALKPVDGPDTIIPDRH